MEGTRWRVLIHRKAEKTLKKMQGEMLTRTRQAIGSLAENPRPVGYKKVLGHKNMFRIRVGGWRIIYALEDDQLIVLVLEVAPRNRIYRNY